MPESTVTYPAMYLGDFTSERTVLLAMVPPEAPGSAFVRALHVLSGEGTASDVLNHWVLRLIAYTGSTARQAAKEVAFPQGFTTVPMLVPLRDPATVKKGDKLALTLTPRGAPSPVTGLCIIVEWGILSTARRIN